MEPRNRVWGAAMAGSPGSGASLEGVSLGSSEEADLRREGRERWGGEAAEGELAPSSTLLPQGLGIWGGGPGAGPREPKGAGLGRGLSLPRARSSSKADRLVSL